MGRMAGWITTVVPAPGPAPSGGDRIRGCWVPPVTQTCYKVQDTGHVKPASISAHPRHSRPSARVYGAAPALARSPEPQALVPLSLSASASVAPSPVAVALRYPDVLLILIAAAPALAAGAPAPGFAVGAAAWILQRFGATAAERQIASMSDFRRQIAYRVVSSMVRVWLLAVAIMVVGVAGTRPDGLTAALVIFAAFSVYFMRSAFEQATRDRDGAR